MKHRGQRDKLSVVVHYMERSCRSLVAGGSCLPNSQTNLVIVIHELFCYFTNATAYITLANKSRHILSKGLHGTMSTTDRKD